jgi:putative oxidoreductase
MSPNLEHMIRCVLRFGLAGVFLYAGLMKLSTDGRAFAAVIVRLQIVPFTWAEHLAAIIPMAELLTGAWLLGGWRLRAAALASAVLAGVFSIAVAQSMMRGLDFDCPCFGVSRSSPSPAFVLLRALFLTGAAGLLYRMILCPEKTAFQ